jgi:hypothetical protein
MDDVMNLGHIFFPNLSFSNIECQELRDSLDIEEPLSANACLHLNKGKEWLRMLALKACEDMVNTGQQDHLIVLWTSNRGLPHNDAVKAFRKVILLRKVDIWGAR